MNDQRLVLVSLELLRRQVQMLPTEIVFAQMQAGVLMGGGPGGGGGSGPPPGGPPLEEFQTKSNYTPPVANNVIQQLNSTLTLLSRTIANQNKPQPLSTFGKALKAARKAFGKTRLGKSKVGKLGMKIGGGVGRFGGKVAGKGLNAAAGGGEKAMGAFITRLTGVLGPLALVAAVLSSASSGFQLLGTGVKLLAATLGPILLPVFFAVGTGLLYLSQELWARILPALGDFYSLVLDSLLPAVEDMVDVFLWVIDTLKPGDFVKGMVKAHSGEGTDSENESTAETLGKLAIWANPITAPIAGARALYNYATEDSTPDGKAKTKEVDMSPGAKMRAARDKESGDGEWDHENADGTPKTAKQIRDDKMKSSQNMMLQELRRSMGPQASFQALTSVNKNAQLAALNSSPIDALILKQQQEAVGLLGKIVSNTTPANSPAFSSGSAGGDF